MSSMRDVAPQDGVTPIFPNASLVADLTGWSGGPATQAWYLWLSPDAVLVRGGESASESSYGFTRRGAGQPGVLYHIGVRAGHNAQGLLERQHPLPLVALSRRAQDFGGISGGASLSPDGRLILYMGRRNNDFFWCADSIDGSFHVSWPMNRPKTRPRGQTLQAVPLSDATWLPDSNGILETTPEWDWVNTMNATVAGRIHLLNSSGSTSGLRLIHLGKILESQYFVLDLASLRLTDTTGGRTIALHPRCKTQDGDPNLTSGGPQQSRPPDQVVVYHWDWLRSDQRSPRAQTEIITMPAGYKLIAKSVSVGGDRVVFALMDRAHHYVVSTGAKIHLRHGDGKISMWMCEMRGGRAAGHLREQCSFVVPFGKEAWCYQRFGLGDWLPGNRRFSFQFASNLYTVAAM